jgi:lipoate-protein ligase A
MQDTNGIKRMQWKIIDSGSKSADENMHLDQELLSQLDSQSEPILHLYEWENDSATYGYFLNPYDFLNEDAVKKKGLHLAKRPTGGGIIFHLCDFAFSVLIPATHPGYSISTLENYALINRMVVRTLERVADSPHRLELLKQDPMPLDHSSKQFCMAKPTKYDVIMDGRKIGGAAQRRTKQGFLHQGTICIATLPAHYLSEILLPNTRVIEAMQANSASLLGDSWTPLQLLEVKAQIKEALKRSTL